MARINLPTVAEMSENQLKQFNRFPSNLSRAMLLTTDCTPAYLSLGASFPRGQLADKDRELVILRVGALSQSAYERMQHYQLALNAGWTEADIEKIETGKPVDARSAIVLRYVDECVESVKVSDKTFNSIRAVFSGTQIAELTLLIGHYMMTARYLETLAVDLDDHPTSWEHMTT